MAGAVPFVLNFNLRFRSTDPRSSVIKVTSHLRTPEVECLTLPHEDGAYEVACNLLNTRITGPEAVLKAAREKADELGIEIVKYYTTGPTESELLDRYNSKTEHSK